MFDPALCVASLALFLVVCVTLVITSYQGKVLSTLREQLARVIGAVRISEKELNEAHLKIAELKQELAFKNVPSDRMWYVPPTPIPDTPHDYPFRVTLGGRVYMSRDELHWTEQPDGVKLPDLGKEV